MVSVAQQASVELHDAFRELGAGAVQLHGVDDAADGAAALFRHELATGDTREVTRAVVPNATSATLAASADGSTVLFARVDDVTIDLMRVSGASPSRN